MKLLSTPILISAFLLAACSNEPQPNLEGSQSATGTQPNVTEQPTSRPIAPPVGGDVPSKLVGNVVETMNSGGYTYALIDTGDATVWAAGPETAVTVGDVVTATGLMAMDAFHSNTLDRDFDMIYFAAALSGDAVAAAHSGSATEPVENASVSVARAEGGQTVEEIFLQKDKLVGTEVLIRAQVVKFSAEIMNTNWIHLQDGSGSAGTNDLTITTPARANVGDIVTVRGTLTADKDFGFGYKYALIIEGAQVTVE